MWTYSQRDGKLVSKSGVAFQGYSGAGTGKNNPAFQSVHNVGPIPVGFYSILSPVDSADHGPYVLRLIPAQENQMFGRAGFLMHGDSKTAPGTASQGCIIMPRAVRQRVWDSEDHQLEVVADAK
jgi:hypothetical protein